MLIFVHQHSTDIRITKGQGSFVVVGFNDFFFNIKFLLSFFVGWNSNLKWFYKIGIQKIIPVELINVKRCKRKKKLISNIKAV